MDIGPIGASALIKICSQRRELDLALELFSRMQVGVGQGGARLGQAGLGWAGLCGAVYEG